MLEIKGIREGLLVSLPEGPWRKVEPELLHSIEERADFIRGAQLVLEIGDRQLGAAELGALRNALSEREITLTTVLSSAEGTRSACADLGLGTERASPAAGESDDLAPISTDLIGEQAALIHRTLRSGQTVRHPGHVVVIGDVNPGAEIVAGGHVVVWGRLRGVVHAGATGDDSAMVCALDLAPTQLRIAGHISISPERKGQVRPEQACVRSGDLIAEPWNPDHTRNLLKEPILG